MNAQRVAWFWPLSFLACLGQLLLLITDNRGGPGTARFLLAVWTLWLPGAGLGNLLTKPGTRLPARLAVEAAAALAVAYLVLLLRGAGWLSPAAAAYLITGIALAAALLLLVLSADRRPRRRRDRRHGAGPLESLLSTAAVAVLLALAAVQLWAGSPLSLRPDAADHVGSIRAAGASAEMLAPRPFDPAGGAPDRDGERGPAHALLDVLCRLSHQDPDRVWDLLPMVAAPLLWCALLFAGGVFFARPVTAAAAAAVALALHALGPGGGSLMTSGYPSVFALVPFWVAVGLCVDNLQRPHLPEVFLFALAVFAAWSTHASLGIALTAVLVLVALRSLTSVDRLQEGLPLLLALWVPAAVLFALYAAGRAGAAGSLDPYRLPAAGLRVLGAGRWVLDAGPSGAFATGAWLLGAAGLLGMARSAVRRAASFYLVAVTAAVALAAFVPFLAPVLTRALGAHAHAWPLVLPVGFLAAAAGEWAAVGLLRSEGRPWLRILVAAGGIVTVGLGLVEAVAGYPHTPRARAALRAAPPESWRDLGAAVADTLPAGTEVLADPATAACLAATAPVRSAYWPAVPWDAAEARRRYLAAAAALSPPAPATEAAGAWPALEAFQRAFPTGAVVANAQLPGGRDLARALTGRGLPVIDLGEGSLAGWLDPPGPGPLPGTSGSPLPRCEGIVAPPAAAGDTLRLTLLWDAPGSHHPLGSRIRVELTRERGPGGGGNPFRRLAEAVGAAVTGRRAALAVESALGAVIPERTPVSVPLAGIPPGAYAVRAAALPGLRDAHRTSRRAGLLAGMPVLATVEVAGTGPGP